MANVQKFWLDADVYIQNANGPYTLRRVPEFWAFLSREAKAGRICSPKIVFDEVTDGNDELAEWMRIRKADGFCIKASRQVQGEFGKIANHVYTKYNNAQSAEFLKGGDGWVIAHAMNADEIVVTQESTRKVTAKVKVPTVCSEMGVKCINTYQMLEMFGPTWKQS
jgi:hypothetical protein